MTKDEALRLALEALEVANSLVDSYYLPKEKAWMPEIEEAITAIKAALEAKDEPVGLIESLKDAQPCCGQYETCWRACTPRGKFIGHRDAQRTWVGLTAEEREQVQVESYGKVPHHVALIAAVEAKLKEKNT